MVNFEGSVRQETEIKVDSSDVTLLKDGSKKVSAVVQNQAYQPLLPKTVPTTKVLVFNLTMDLSEKTWEAKEAYLASVAIQGLVNRTSDEKIYFIHTPQEHDWVAFAADEAWLKDGLIPVEKEYPVLNNSKQYPVLSYLLEHYEKVVKGKVYYPNLSSSVVDGAVMAAITAAGVDDALPVTQAIDEYVESEGYSYTEVADTRGFRNNIDAFDWTYDNYFTKTNHNFIAQHSFTSFGGGLDDQFPIQYDYYIANKVFAFNLDANKPDELARLQQFLTPANYVPGTPVLGVPVDEGPGVEVIQQAGYYFAILYVPNLTVTSSFPSDASLFTPLAPPAAAEVQDNDIYISFYVTDGDSMGFPTNFEYEKVRNSPSRSNVPIGWSFNPLLVDLFPTLLKWYSENDYGQYYELVANFNNNSVPDTFEGEQAFLETYKHYVDNSNGTLKTLNYFYYGEPTKGDRLVEYVAPYFLIKGYQGMPGGNDIQWGTLGDTQIPMTNLSGGTQGTATVDNIYNAIKRVGESTPSGEPGFAVITIGDGRHSGDPAAHVQEAIEALYAENPSRNYVFMRPVDLAATWKVSQGLESAGGDLPQILQKPSANAAPSRVEIYPSDLELVAGDNYNVKAKVFDSSNQAIFNYEVKWDSDNQNVASINSNGIIQAKARGTAVITATANNKTSEIVVKVINREPNSLGLSKRSFVAFVGAEVKVDGKVFDQFGAELKGVSLIWSVDDEAVATIDTTGFITAIDKGQAHVTVSYGNITETIVVTVVDSADSIAYVVMDPSQLSMFEDDMIVIKAKAYDRNDQEIIGLTPTWNSSDTSIASVDEEGIITGASIGEAKVTGTYVDTDGELTVRVLEDTKGQKLTFEDRSPGEQPGEFPAVTFENNGWEVFEPQGKIQGNTISFSDRNATEKAIIFKEPTMLNSLKVYNPKSQADKVRVTSAQNGDMILEVRSKQTLTLKTGWKNPVTSWVIHMSPETVIGEFVYAEPDPVPTTIEVNVEQIDLIEGETLQLVAQIYDQKGRLMEGKLINWSTDNSTVATVDENGFVTAKRKGPTFIQVKTGDLATAILTVIAQK